MDKLLESKKIRERDRQRALDVKLRRELEKDGDKYQDKTTYVTNAYKKQQEEIQKSLLEEEEEQKKESKSKFLSNNEFVKCFTNSN